MKTVHRLVEYIKFKNISFNKFDESIGASTGYISRMANNNSSIGSDIIERIVKIYPDLNLIWLITGKEDMTIRHRDPKDIIIIDQANQIRELRSKLGLSKEFK